MAAQTTFMNSPNFEDGSYKTVMVAGILIIMQFLMVSGRFVSRRLNKAGQAADDYVLLLATPLTVGLCSIAIACRNKDA